MTARRQLPLALHIPPSRSADDFLVADCNREALRWLDRWPDWPSTALVLYGPPGCGKTHLAHVFAARSGAAWVVAEAGAGITAVAAGHPAVLVDDADRLLRPDAEEPLLHLYNTLAERRGHLLLTAEAPPSRWPLALADLRSRLLAAPAVGIGAPDDETIAGILVKLLRDRQLKVEDDVVLYALPRIERSYAAVHCLVEELDAAALGRRRKITVPLLRELLDEGDGNGRT